MGEHNYHEWFGDPEPCPALYIHITRPTEDEPVLPDLLAAIDSGSSLTCVPAKYKERCRLVTIGNVKVKWPSYPTGTTPAYMAYVTADGYRRMLVEIVFDPFHHDYAIIGRNMLKHWHVTLRGPESILDIREPQAGTQIRPNVL